MRRRNSVRSGRVGLACFLAAVFAAVAVPVADLVDDVPAVPVPVPVVTAVHQNWT